MQGTFKELLHSDVDYAQMLHLGEEDEEAADDDKVAAAEGAKKPEDSRPLMRALRQLSRVSSKVVRPIKSNPIENFQNRQDS